MVIMDARKKRKFKNLQTTCEYVAQLERKLFERLVQFYRTIGMKLSFFKKKGLTQVVEC